VEVQVIPGEPDLGIRQRPEAVVSLSFFSPPVSLMHIPNPRSAHQAVELHWGPRQSSVEFLR
jgi:hypothetical protein